MEDKQLKTTLTLKLKLFSEVAPEEDVVLLTGNFDVYSEVSNG